MKSNKFNSSLTQHPSSQLFWSEWLVTKICTCVVHELCNMCNLYSSSVHPWPSFLDFLTTSLIPPNLSECVFVDSMWGDSPYPFMHTWPTVRPTVSKFGLEGFPELSVFVSCWCLGILLADTLSLIMD